LNRSGRPLLADFNIARSSNPSAGQQSLGGTPAYMAPEHLEAFLSFQNGDNSAWQLVDAAADVYSLGVILFEMLAGHLPYPVAGALTEMAATRRARPPWLCSRHPEVPEIVAHVVQRCLDPEPRQRYPSAAELVIVLDGCRQWRQRDRHLRSAGPVTRAVGRF